MKRFVFMVVTALLAVLPVRTQTMKIIHKGDTTEVCVERSAKFLLLPIEEEQPEVQVMSNGGTDDGTWMDIRLAVNKIDYYVPLALEQKSGAVIKIRGLKSDALTLQDGKMILTDKWNAENTDVYRPHYHHTPPYGWMNDPNGMFYKDGVYHLCYQYNPYGSKWGNMYWGHAVSRDLVHWKTETPVLARDTMGHIFSGSAVVDKEGTAGFGKDAIIALYTSANDENGQVQCMAYSTDGGYTFTKYAENPVLKPFDGLKDFRDPKVFWYEPAKQWYMIVSADKEMRFYASPNLKEWTYVSAFGKGYGAQPNQFECPDFFELCVDGNPNNKKWVMIVNINPGCLFGGSATEYFVGSFNGKDFICDSEPNIAKFLDYGKDHYAAVCFANTGKRTLSIAWMSNWQYANATPIRQHRGANTLPRELSLFSKDGETYLAADVAPEVRALRQDTLLLDVGKVNGERVLKTISKSNDNAFEIELDVKPCKDGTAGIELFNEKGEKVDLYIDMKNGKFVTDRTESGLTAFGEQTDVHKIERTFDQQHQSTEGETRRKRNAVNYVNDFALGTWAPLSLCNGKTYHLDIFVDKCSVEVFVDGGRIAMTNLVFPTLPYTAARFYSKGGTSTFGNVRLHHLSISNKKQRETITTFEQTTK